MRFVDSFRYLGVIFHESGDFQHAADAVAESGAGKMWAVFSKIRSLFAIHFSFALTLFSAIIQGSHVYGAEIWLPLTRTKSIDLTFVNFVQHFFHLHNKTGHKNMYLLTGKLPFSIWARKFAVSFHLRGIAAPYDTLVHQCIVQLTKFHNAGKHNWLSVVQEWVRAWDPRFRLQIV